MIERRPDNTSAQGLRVGPHLLLVLTVLVYGCGSSRPQLDMNTINDSLTVSYIRDGAIQIANVADSLPPQTLNMNDVALKLTESFWSPDGSVVGYLGRQVNSSLIGKIGEHLLSDKELVIGVYDLATNHATSLGQLKPVCTPQWTYDGSGIIAVEDDELKYVNLEGTWTTLASLKHLRGFDCSPSSFAIAYYNSDSIFVIDLDTHNIMAVGGARRPHGLFAADPVMAVSFSPDGARIAYSTGGNLNIFDLASKSSTRVYGSRHYIYWIDWRPDGDRLYFLKGRENVEKHTNGILPSTYTVRGHFELWSVSSDGIDRQKLYKQTDIDVRRANPSLSSDGTLIALRSRVRGDRNLMFLVATDGSGVARFRKAESSSSTSWAPASVDYSHTNHR